MRTQCIYYSSPRCLAFSFCLKTKTISLPPSLPVSLFLFLSFLSQHFLPYSIFSILMSVISLSLPHNHNIRTLLFELTSDSNYHALMLSYITSHLLQQKLTVALLLKCKKKRKKSLPRCSFTHMHLCAYLWIYHAIMVMAQSSSYQILCLFLDVCPVELKGI